MKSHRNVFLARTALALGLLVTASASHAEDRFLYGFIGGWGYQLTGSVVNGAKLDFDRDLGLQTSDRKNYALGYVPAKLGWIPALDLDYVRIAAHGQQVFAGTALFGTVQLTNGATVNDSADINDMELAARWPFKVADFTFSAGLNVTRLNGNVVVAVANSAQQTTQKIDQTFPLPSLSVAWQPIESVRVSLRGDYIQYDGNSAETFEGNALWKIVGPFGIEAGYRHRRYKVINGNFVLDAKQNGARVGIRYELPF